MNYQGCNLNIPTDVGINFGYCFFEYFILPAIIAIVLVILGLIIYIKIKQGEGK